MNTNHHLFLMALIITCFAFTSCSMTTNSVVDAVDEPQEFVVPQAMRSEMITDEEFVGAVAEDIVADEESIPEEVEAMVESASEEMPIEESMTEAEEQNSAMSSEQVNNLISFIRGENYTEAYTLFSDAYKSKTEYSVFKTYFKDVVAKNYGFNEAEIISNEPGADGMTVRVLVEYGNEIKIHWVIDVNDTFEIDSFSVDKDI